MRFLWYLLKTVYHKFLFSRQQVSQRPEQQGRCQQEAQAESGSQRGQGVAGLSLRRRDLKEEVEQKETNEQTDGGRRATTV